MRSGGGPLRRRRRAVHPGGPPRRDHRAPAPLRIPRFEGRRGHPVWFSNALLPEFLALPAGAAARDVVTRHSGEIAYIDVEDPGILADVDDPSAYAALLASGMRSGT